MKNEELRLGIVGFGFVGKATDQGFNKNVNKFIVDPLLGTTIKELASFNPTMVFVCVPTPMGDDGDQDATILESVISELCQEIPESIIVIKSTVIPKILSRLKNKNPKLIYNPEFLREKHAKEDFINSKSIIIGGDKEIAESVAYAYKNHSQCLSKDYIYTDIETASLIKYSINTFLATKVIFFNEIFNIFEKISPKDSWEKIISIISSDERIGRSHMDVPGHDGRKGFGGACFPKDSLALVKYASEIGLDMTVLKKVIKSNNNIRSKYAELDARESEQNVSFDDKI